MNINKDLFRISKCLNGKSVVRQLVGINGNMYHQATTGSVANILAMKFFKKLIECFIYPISKNKTMGYKQILIEKPWNFD